MRERIDADGDGAECGLERAVRAALVCERSVPGDGAGDIAAAPSAVARNMVVVFWKASTVTPP